MRLDQYLFQNGLTGSRQRAQALIMAGTVYVNGEKALKAGTAVPENANVELRGKDIGYVSRGGLKLEKALRVFPINPTGKICMDIGASTGGFTDCLLQNGAQKVYAVDVGYGQLAWKLRCDERVVVFERCNIRKLTPKMVAEKIDLFTVDVSFISLKHVFPLMHMAGGEACEGVCLVKPQFEAGKEKVGKKGVVRDATTHIEVIRAAAEYALQNGFSPMGLSFSPIKGPEGNIEFLLYVRRNSEPEGLPKGLIEDTVAFAHEELKGGGS